jgi:DNA (cytosine-5)-methyltransferase 1
MANADKPFWRVGNKQPAGQLAIHEQDAGIALRAGSRNGSFWSDAEWIVCHDGKARRAKPSLCFLVDGLPGRVDLWRIGGNAISPVLAAEVLASFLETEVRAAA